MILNIYCKVILTHTHTYSHILAHTSIHDLWHWRKVSSWWGGYGTVMITVSMNPAVSVDPQSKRKKKKAGMQKSLFAAIDALLYAFACISTSAPLFFSSLYSGFESDIAGLIQFSLIVHSLYISLAGISDLFN